VLGLCLLLLLTVALPASPARAATNDLTTALQRGLFEEEANQNLGAAILAYQSVAGQFDKDRRLAATAIFRLGECYRKQGNTNDAAVYYERILREFSDQPTLVTLSRQNLAGMGSALQAPGQAATKQYTVVSGDTLSSIVGVLGVSGQALMDANPGLYSAGLRVGQVLRIPTGPESSTASSGAPVVSDAARQEQKRLLEEEMKLVQKQMEALQQQRDANGAISPGDPLPLQRQMLELKRQVAALDAGLPISFAASGTTAPGTSSEADEVRRIQALIKDSPDLVNAPVENGLTLLQSAAAKGKLAVVKQLLDSGAAVDGLQQPGPTPLHFAADNGHKAVVDLLLSKGAKVDAQTENGATPLHLAARQGYESVAKALLTGAGASVNAQTKGRGANSNFGMDPLQLNGLSSGQTPLHLAAKAGYTGMVQLLLAKGADVNAEDGDGRTPLSYAAQRPAILELLLAAHANPNAGRLDLPLALAAFYGEMPALKVLLANGANPNTNSALSFSVNLPFGQISPRGAKVTPLFLAVTQRHTDAAKELLRCKADPNMPGGYSSRPVVGEALSDIPTLKVLLDGGADPNASNQGVPMLQQAVADKNQPAVELLLAHKADVNAARSDGWTPLLSAVAGGDKAIAELLIKAGAAVNARNKDGQTPLWVAVERNRLELAELLLANKADPNAKGVGGWTALHFAVSRGLREMVELLLANKADPNERNNDGQTPLDLAKSQAQSAPGLPPGVPARPVRMVVPGAPPGSPQALTYQWRQTPGTPATTPGQESKPETMVDLLRRNGALDDLPQLDRITVQRLGIRVNTPFTKGAHDWSQFTLLDLIGVQYGFLAASPNEGQGGRRFAADFFNNHNSLPFPALAHLRIRRPAADRKGWEEQVVDLSLVLGSGDCSKDVRLGWGDVVEVPETDHPLNEKWPGFSRTELMNLKKCLTRQVEIVVKGQATNITLAPQISNLEEETQPAPTPGAPPPLGRRGTREPLIGENTPFWLKPVLFQFKLVLTSSDLSRVKVTRHDPAAGQERQWVVDCSEISPAPDFWLRDGDKIEVPEKTDASATAQAPGPQSPPK
jgi:ankyrin repeat protein